MLDRTCGFSAEPPTKCMVIRSALQHNMSTAWSFLSFFLPLKQAEHSMKVQSLLSFCFFLWVLLCNYLFYNVISVLRLASDVAHWFRRGRVSRFCRLRQLKLLNSTSFHYIPAAITLFYGEIPFGCCRSSKTSVPSKKVEYC